MVYQINLKNIYTKPMEIKNSHSTLELNIWGEEKEIVLVLANHPPPSSFTTSLLFNLLTFKILSRLL